MKLYECTQDVGSKQLLVARPLASYVWSAASHYFLDFSLNQRGRRKPKLPSCYDPIASSTGQNFHHISAAVSITSTSFFVPPRQAVEAEERRDVVDLSDEEGEEMDVCDACGLLEGLMAQDGIKDVVRCVNVYQRALGADPLGSGLSARVGITISLSFAPTRDGDLTHKHWHFVATA